MEDTEKQLFIEFVKQITTQRLDSLFDEMYRYVTEKSFEDVFCERHPEACWIMDKIKYVYTYHFHPLVETYISENQTGQISDKERQQLIRSSVERIGFQIAVAFKNETAGLDYELILALASENYESRGASGLNIVILPDCDDVHFGQEGAFLFNVGVDQRELVYDEIHTIRKQLNLTGKGALAIAKNYESNNFCTLGVMPESALYRYPSITFKKTSEWEYWLPVQQNRMESNSNDDSLPDKTEKRQNAKLEKEEPKRNCILRYSRGMFKLPVLDLENEIKEELSQIFNNAYESDEDIVEICENITRIVLHADKCEHGAGLIFLYDEIIEDEINRLVSGLRRGMKLPEPICLCDSTETLVQLANIDGALLVGYSGKCYAYGVILDGVPQKDANIGRGARFNSTKAYVEHNMYGDIAWPVIGIVKSEDGMLDIFPERAQIKITHST